MLLFGAAGILANWVAGKMLNKSIPLTTAFFLSGTIFIPLLLYYSGGNTIHHWGRCDLGFPLLSQLPKCLDLYDFVCAKLIGVC
jgi:hypothetical protein